jgi:hypothetical protein
VFKAHSPAGQAVLNSIHSLQLSNSHADAPAFLSQLQQLQDLSFQLALAPKRNRKRGAKPHGSSSSSDSNAQSPGPHLLSLQGLSALTSLSVKAQITCSLKEQPRQRAVQARLMAAIGRLTQLQEVVFDGVSSVWPAAQLFAPLARLSGLQSLLLEYTEAQQPSGLEQLTDLTGMCNQSYATNRCASAAVGCTQLCTHTCRKALHVMGPCAAGSTEAHARCLAP